MTIKELSQVHHTLVSSSTRKPRWVVRGWHEHYPNVIREIQWGCCPPQQSSKLLSLWDPISLICVSTQPNACRNRAQPMRSLIDTDGG
jgi:hypothetical protein